MVRILLFLTGEAAHSPSLRALCHESTPSTNEIDVQSATVHPTSTLSTTAIGFCSLPPDPQSESVDLYLLYIERLSA